MGEPAWQEVPGEHRNTLRRLIVTQGDTEPASVEQQRLLGHTAPSLYDLRNLFQVNVEEGRHLWAMVYLLHSYFGRDGREEAEELLAAPQRQPRQAAHPGRLQRADRQLARLLHVHDVHRPRRQVPAPGPRRERLRSRSRAPRASCSPRRRTTCSWARPGVERIVQRTAELMKQDPNGDARAQGGIDLATIQKYLNLWFALSLDLFGGEISSQRGVLLRGRPQGPREGGRATPTTGRSSRSTAWPCSKDGALVERGRGPAAQRHERGAARRVRRGLPARRRPLEQAPRGGGPRRAPAPAQQALLPAHRALRRPALRPRGPAPARARSGSARSGEWLPTDGGPRLRDAAS